MEIEDQPAFAEIAEREEPVTSDLTFANLFVWRNTYGFRLSVLRGALCVIAEPPNGQPFLLAPIAAADPAAVVRELSDYLSQRGHVPSLRRASGAFVQRLQASAPAQVFKAELDRDNSDYVYLASDLINLEGRNYHKKRNQIAQFRSRYRYEYRSVTPDLLPQLAAFQQTWCDVRGCFTPENISLAEENTAVAEAIANFELLGLVGGAILVDGKVEAFTIGGPLNRDCLVVHFEKGNPSFPGIYQVVNQAFCADACTGYTFVNREQDLGDPGLRQAKESYYPDHMIDKYTVALQ